MRKIWINIPAYTGTVHIGTMRSVLTDLLALVKRGDVVSIEDECGNAYIDDARALLVAKFLKSDGTDLIFIDWDVVFEAGTLLKLVDAPVEFVAAVYPYRVDPINFPISWNQHEKEIWANKDGLIRVWGVPLGCARISRSVLEKMVDVYTDSVFVNENAPDGQAWALFGNYRRGKYKFAEDYAFCNRWRDIGGEIFIDPEIKMGHIGFKTFTGSIGEWLRGRTENND